jgi:tetratricopeptide (TPR) repeat protein
MVALIKEQNPNNVYVDIKRAVKFATDDKNMQFLYSRDRKDAYIPSNRFKITVDPAKVIANGTVDIADSAKITDVKWQINKNVVLKNHFMVLDLLASFDWERPIYFACTTGPDSYIGLQDHFQLEGLTYRLIPIKTTNQNPNLYGRVGTDKMYRNVTEKFRWGNMDADDVYLDENVIRMATNLRLQMNHLAQALIEEGDDEKAREILNLSLAMMPDRNVPFDRLLMPAAEAYYELGDYDQANQLTEHLFDLYEENMNYYFSLESQFMPDVEQEMQIGNVILQRLYSTALQNKQDELAEKLKGRMENVNALYQNRLIEMQNAGRKTIRGNF